MLVLKLDIIKNGGVVLNYVLVEGILYREFLVFYFIEFEVKVGVFNIMFYVRFFVGNFVGFYLEVLVGVG